MVRAMRTVATVLDGHERIRSGPDVPATEPAVVASERRIESSPYMV